MEYTKKLLIFLLTLRNLASADRQRWNPTKVSVSTIAKPTLVSENYAGGYIQAALVCAWAEWCHAFCEENPGEFVLMDMFVVALNEDPAGPPFLNCFTDREKRNILTGQSNVTIHDASAVFSQFYQRKPVNLLDGYFDKDRDNAYLSDPGTNNFVVFDLGSTFKVRSVTVQAEPGPMATQRFKEIQVRVGNTPQTGDFSSYTLIGYMPGAASGPSHEFKTPNPEPVPGRYVSVQSVGYLIGLQICLVEIFT